MPADNRAAWNAVSKEYQDTHRISTDDAHYGPRTPTERELRLVGDVRGKRLLEIGCGGGQCAVAFARQGAIVSGKDLSEEQLAFARALAEREGVQVDFHHGTIEDLAEFGDGSQEIVFSAWALPYVEDFDRCVREVYRVLRRHGIFVFSAMHPFSGVLSDQGPPWVAARAYWEVAREWHWDDDPAKPRFREHSRTIGETFDALRGAGFLVDRIIEPKPLLHDRDSWDSSYPLERLKLVPATIIFRTVKPD